MTSTTSHTDEQQRTPYERERQQETTIHCIDEARHNIQSAIEEARREIPRCSQSVTDFQNEAADATREISKLSQFSKRNC